MWSPCLCPARLLPARTSHPLELAPTASSGRILPSSALPPGRSHPSSLPRAVVSHLHGCLFCSTGTCFQCMKETRLHHSILPPAWAWHRAGAQNMFDSVHKYTDEKKEGRCKMKEPEERTGWRDSGRSGRGLAAVPWSLGLCMVPLCVTWGQRRPFPSFLRPSFPSSLVLHSEFLDEAQLYSLYFLFFFPILYIIKVFFSILLFFFSWSQKTEETIFIKNLIKNSKEVVLGVGHMEGKGASHSGMTLLCVKELYPCKWIFGFRAWERGEENKGVGEKPQSFWERGPCLCLLETIWSSVCLREMPLG